MGSNSSKAKQTVLEDESLLFGLILIPAAMCCVYLIEPSATRKLSAKFH